MSDEKPGGVIETRELFSVQFREADDYPWKEIGTHKEDAADILRVYDYSVEHRPDEQVRMVRTNVEVAVEDPERIRELLREKTAQAKTPGLQSE